MPNGFEYGDLDEERKVASLQARLRWLDSSEPFSQQPYEELARLYRKRGQIGYARRVKLEEERKRTRRAKLPPLSYAWNLFLEWAVGYGYRPGRILGVVAAFAVAGALIFHVAQHNNIMEAVTWLPPRCIQPVGKQGGILFTAGEPAGVVPRDASKLEAFQDPRKADEFARFRDSLPLPDEIRDLRLPPAPANAGFGDLPPCTINAAKCTSYYPCFHPAIYSVELLIPVVNLRQLTYWLPDMSANSKHDTREGSKRGSTWYLVGIWYVIYTWIAILLGWVAVTALGAGIGRVWRTD